MAAATPTSYSAEGDRGPLRLLDLRERLLEMGGFAEAQLGSVLDALRRRDFPLALTVADRDTVLDQMEQDLEAHAIHALVLGRPLARELRETIAVLRISSSIERIGDLAKNIARRAEAFGLLDAPRLEAALLDLGDLIQAQLVAAIDAYGDGRALPRDAIRQREREIDSLFAALFSEHLALMRKAPSAVVAGAQLLFIAKNLERIGDHCAFIVEMTDYVAIGGSPAGAATGDLAARAEPRREAGTDRAEGEPWPRA